MRKAPSTVSNSGNDDQADDQHVERGHAPVHEHLVDDDLKEERRDQRKQLQEEGGDEHLAEQAPILVDAPREPGDVEPSSQVNQGCAAGHKDEPPVPEEFKLIPLHERRARRERGLNQDRSLCHFAQQQEAAVTQDSNGRKRRFCQA